MAVLFVLGVLGIALGSWIDHHRATLGPYLLLWGGSWIAAGRAIRADSAYLERTLNARAGLLGRWPGYRRRPDRVQRDLRRQRWLMTWGLGLVGAGIMATGIAVGVAQVVGAG